MESKNIENKKIEKKSKSKTKRCNHKDCRKKISIIDIPCKCGLIFCINHKFFSNHNCTYDYKENHKQNLIKCNPKIINKSIEVI
tara:strand:+ start:91 stop:342 length:252 start_codon:yes stop_codon:yes gene_type:complete